MNLFREIYYVTDGIISYYTLEEPDETEEYYEIFEVEALAPYLAMFPHLLQPQLVH